MSIIYVDSVNSNTYIFNNITIHWFDQNGNIIPNICNEFLG